MGRNKSFVPVNYRDFVHKLEEIITPITKQYKATEGDKATDKDRFDQYKEDMTSKMGQYMVHKRNEENNVSPSYEMTNENPIKQDEISPEEEKKKQYRLNTENFF